MSESRIRRFGRRWLRHYPGLIGSMLLLIMIVICALGYLISPDNTQNANHINASYMHSPPGTSYKYAAIWRPTAERHVGLWEQWLHGQPDVYQDIDFDDYYFYQDSVILTRDGLEGKDSVRLSIAAAVEPVDPTVKIFGHLGFLRYKLVGSDTLVGGDVENLRSAFKIESENSRTYLLGTDELGRDVLSRLIIGGRVTLLVGILATLLAMVIGIIVGSVAGYMGGRVDGVISWVMNVVWSIPTLLLVLSLGMVFAGGIGTLIMAIGFTIWVDVARLVRGQVMSAKQSEYVLAGVAMGYSKVRIIFKHILPNISNVLWVMAASVFSTSILLEAGMSFLGLGVPAPAPSWGRMVSDYYMMMLTQANYLCWIPGALVGILVLSVNMIGNGLRDVLDVRAQ